ncbi:hypothetical protein FB451DRAFT_1149013 [Mycena latifolia]|nr:hypothetical protein FB451DRAFT_1149013 [Mycena latifolia]
MRFSLAVAALAPVLSVYADNILVQVGAGGQLAFSPTNITAKVGDVIAFQFQGKNHSVTQSTFANPCAIQTTPAQGIDSGFQLVAANATQLPQWSFTVNNDTAPLWFFCAQTIPANHCQAGMVFSVNANPDSPKSFAAYQALAKGNAAAAGPAAASAGSAISAATSDAAGAVGAATSDAAGAVGAATSAIGAGVAAATSAAPGAVSTATSAIGGAIGAATSILGGAAGAAESALTGAGFRTASSGASLLAVVGLAAGLLL